MPIPASRICKRPTVIDWFLPRRQCVEILDELRFAFWSPSTVTVKRTHREVIYISPQRVSESTDERWFTSELRRAIKTLDCRLSRIVPRFRERRELWQATRYRRGDKFDYHLDAGHWTRERPGDREWTVMVYLDTPRSGGKTHFRNLNVSIAARGGRLVTWRNLNEEHKPDTDMLHASWPLRNGSKTVLITWVRQRPIHRRQHT
jgi:prolyl 4-hydroxylase